MSKLLTGKNIWGYIKLLLIATGITIVFTFNVIGTTVTNTINKLNTNIDNIIVTDGIDLNILCTVSGCEYIKHKNRVYKKDVTCIKATAEKFSMNRLPWLPKNTYVTDTNEIVIFNPKYDIYIVLDEMTEVKSLLKVSLYNWIIMVIILTFYYFKGVIEDVRANRFEIKALKLELESKLQRTIAESAHHEMLQPVAIIKTMFLDIIDNLKLIFEHEECKSKFSDINKEMLLYMDKIILNIERLEAVLYQMSETKHLKYSNGDTSLLKIINNVMAGINSFSLTNSSNKLTYEIDDKYNNLEKYSTCSGLTNGTLLNIINNHITNSKDAKSSNIVFEVGKVIDNKLSVKIKDDGVGIRDIHGNIIDINDIFEAGYTTKDKTGKNIIIKKTFIDNIYEYIAIFFNLESANKIMSARGVGLYINRELMRKAGGEIRLLSTSETGTVFELVIPVKLKE